MLAHNLEARISGDPGLKMFNYSWLRVHHVADGSYLDTDLLLVEVAQEAVGMDNR